LDDLPNLLLIPKVLTQVQTNFIKKPQDLSHRRIHSHEIRLDDLNSLQKKSFMAYSPKINEKKTTISLKKETIPALYLRYSLGSNKILLYFHGNAEDLGMISVMLGHMSQYLKVNILAVEYPGYGIYKGGSSSKLLNEDAEIIYSYIVNRLEFKAKDVIVIGRSIGSGPSCHLASMNAIGSLVLISPFKSIKSVVKSVLGTLAAFLIADRFKNIENMKKIVSPILFIHGKKDRIIPVEHSLEMGRVCKELGKIHEVYLNEEMGHNNLSTLQDFCLPLVKFCIKMRVEIKNDVKYVREMPEETAWKIKGGEIEEKKRKSSLIKTLLEKNLREI